MVQRLARGPFKAEIRVRFPLALPSLLSLENAILDFAQGSGGGRVGIGLVIVIIAALNLILEFDRIENAACRGAPRYTDWYGVFGLMVTLIGLDREILRLLAKTRRR